MNLLSSSCGNDSLAMILQCVEKQTPQVEVIYCHTGWSSPEWPERVERIKAYARSNGMAFTTLHPEKYFADLMRERKGFPMPGRTWCSFWLKAMPFLTYADRIDPKFRATIFLGKRRDESFARRNTPLRIPRSVNHGGRKVYHPLAYVREPERNKIIRRHGFDVLPGRSKECSPCVNANRTDMRQLGEADQLKTVELEAEIGQNMFRPHHHMGAVGFEQVMIWAWSPRGKYEPQEPTPGCTEGYCE